MAKTPCKTCEGKGLLLGVTQLRSIGSGNILPEDTIRMVPEPCDCCGGWWEDCENCARGYRYINWVDEENYGTAIIEWLEDDVLPLIQQASAPLDYSMLYDKSPNDKETEIMFNYLYNLSRQDKKDISDDAKQLIPGNAKKDVVVLARRTRLIMVQILYNRGRITLEEAHVQLNGNLSADNPKTYFDDRELLRVKENDNGSEEIN